MNELLQRVPVVLSWRGLRLRIEPELAGVGAPDHVALTFDDGPSQESTPGFLDKLANLDVTATFFMLGSQIRRSPSLACEVAAAGHEIALHGYDHTLLVRRSPAAVRDDLRRGYDTIGELVGVVPRWWRPPYGVLTHASLETAEQLGLQTILWTTWGRDWTASATPTSVLTRVARNLDGGGTILLHDSDVTAAPGSWRSALGAVHGLVAICRDHGWRVGPLAAHGIGRA